jgi:hypothetical protein
MCSKEHATIEMRITKNCRVTIVSIAKEILALRLIH